MILVFGGTTEGRAALKVLEGSGRPYLYSTLGASQDVATPGGRRLTGALTAAGAAELCRREGVRLIVDAAHPFAEGVHATAAWASAACGIPVVRYDRREVADTVGVVWCDDWADASTRLEAAGVRRLLALTGVRTIPKLRPFWERRPTLFRVLDRPESIAEAAGYGFPPERLIYYNTGESEMEVMRRVAPDAVLTKESGPSGGFPEKIAAARALNIPIYAVRRPAAPHNPHTVYTETGLRRRVEELLPGYFPLRSGYTTGTCATVAAVAALRGLLAKEVLKEVEVTLPGGERVALPVAEMTPDNGGGTGSATVIKEAGDDPDVTNGCRITARVSLTTNGGVRFLQGEGVGRVTLPGLGLEVGEPAINPVPRQMIRDNFAALAPHISGADVTISVEGGAELAARTFNPKLGIEGGISIIGTSGIVSPFSDAAFIEAIEREIAVAWAVGCRELVINSGAKSESVVRGRFPELPPQAFVHYGNAIGQTLAAAARAGFPKVTMGLMIGKAVKLAGGRLDTHSRESTMNREFLKTLAADAGCTPTAGAAIDSLTLARELWTVLSGADRARFMPALLAACHTHCAPLLPDGKLSILLIDETGRIAFSLK
jgi:cobalt-precorrin-5B (C1)-methyltransferase